ncbi:MAG: FAD-binding oxidoreductase [Acidobacteriia bacterium]|nr:FAD-binding oxidoreductase [Terriglobia bacterium]
MSVPQLTARVEQIHDLTHDVRELQLRLLDPPQIDFKAGQFVSFQINRKDLPAPTSRPYSIASPAGEKGIITLVFNRVQGGPGSEFLFGLKERDEVRFTGPAGHFYLREDADRDFLFVVTGTGIAPVRSMLYDLFNRQPQKVVKLFWGLRSERDLYYQDELNALSRDHNSFSFVTTLSRPSELWTGERGRVTRLVERIDTVERLAVYLCGGSGMIKEVTDLIRGKGLCPIYREKFY